MADKTIKLGLIHYPGTLRSALYGLEELFLMASQICTEQGVNVVFEPQIIDSHTLRSDTNLDVLMLLPSYDEEFYINPAPELLDWLNSQHKKGTIVATTCAGAFIAARAGLLEGKACTTHWKLENQFKETFPHITLKTGEIIINQGDVITSGGMMSWLDLGFELVTLYSKSSVLRELGHILVIDTSQREQRYYHKFTPRLNHGDDTILNLQHYLGTHYQEHLSITMLAEKACLSERTLQRRFFNATGLKPTRYIQNLRIQKTCDLLETTSQPFESIAYSMGYQSASALRKRFIEEMGLTPKAFRERFYLANKPYHEKESGPLT
jgi:transcriptional regulator GlxA family with amidase domain